MYMWWRKKKKTLPLLVLIQGSLQPRGLSDCIFEEALRLLADQQVAVVTIDVRNRNIDFYHSGPLEKGSKETREMFEVLKLARGYLIAMPVYSAKTAGAIKDFLVFGAPAMRGKVASLVCVGKNDVLYPATRDVLGILHDGLNISVMTPVVRASPESFHDGRIFDEQVSALLSESIAALIKKIAQ